MAAAEKPYAAHFGGRGSPGARRAVFNNNAVLRGSMHLLCSVQEQIRRRLPARDHGGRKYVITEEF
jgi:hypothetical protein